MAFHTSSVYNMPGDNKNSIEKSDEDGDKKINETTKKRLSNDDFKGERRCPAIISNLELKLDQSNDKQEGKKHLLEGNHGAGPVRYAKGE